MSWLLDTNVVSAAIRGVPAVVERLRAAAPSAVCISPVTVAELRYGAARRASPALDGILARILAGLRVEALGPEAADRAGLLMAHEQSRGRILHLPDALIAAQAIVGGHVLVSRDRDVAGIAGVQVEDWEAG